METRTKDQGRVWWLVGGAVAVAIAASAFGVPLSAVLLIGLLLLCPLLMMGMHGGGHEGHGGHEPRERDPASQPARARSVDRSESPEHERRDAFWNSRN